MTNHVNCAECSGMMEGKSGWLKHKINKSSLASVIIGIRDLKLALRIRNKLMWPTEARGGIELKIGDR